MIIISEATIKIFIRLQLASQVKRDVCIEKVLGLCGDLFSSLEIEDWTNEIYAGGIKVNEKVIDKLMLMLEEFVSLEYYDLNIDDDDLDEADRLKIEIIESIGLLED